MFNGHIFLTIGSVLLLILMGLNSYCDYSQSKNYLMAKESLSKGFPRVANQLTQNLRKRVKFSKEECDLILSIDGALKSVDNLKMNAEKCLYSGHVSLASPYLALSVAYELENSMDNSQKVLLAAIKKTNHHKDIYRRLALINFNQDKKENSLQILNGLVQRNQESEEVIREVIQFFTLRGEWKYAYNYVEQMEKLKTMNFETQITMYGVSKRNNDKKRAEKYLSQVNQVLAKLPKEKALKIRAQIEKI